MIPTKNHCSFLYTIINKIHPKIIPCYFLLKYDTYLWNVLFPYYLDISEEYIHNKFQNHPHEVIG